MLAPDARALLLEQLAPLPGTRFDAAVATTFTLDLTATLLPALSFTGFHLAGGTSDPIATLESIRNTANRIDVFCQAGAIGVPAQAPDLLAFLEPMIHPVRAPVGGLFHPKLWFVRYVDESGTPSYRLLVLSRNLTLDSSWDIVVRLDSQSISSTSNAAGAALAELLASLPERSTNPASAGRNARFERVQALAEEARRVVWEPPSGAESVHLHYLDKGRDSSLDFRGVRHLVVSPFLDAGGLRRVRAAGPIDILSRVEELEKLDPESLERLNARVLDDLAVSQAVDNTRLGGHMHAKMYVVEQRTNWSKAHVFLGSANATTAAFSTNTEFMVEIRGPKKKFGIDQFFGAEGTFIEVTEPYAPTGQAGAEPDDLAQLELEKGVRRLAGLGFTAEVVASKPDSGHDLRLKSGGPFSLEPGWTAMVELLTLTDFAAPVQPGTALDAIAPGVATKDVTPFLVIRVHSPIGLTASTVVVAELINAPSDRLDVILASQIDSPEKFLRFLFFLLSLGNPAALAALASEGADPEGNGAKSPFGHGGSGVLELVLGAIASNPSSLRDLDALVTRLGATDEGQRALPDGFQEFWAVVRDAAGLATGVAS